MANAVRMREKDQSEFVKLFSSLADRHQSWQLWSDFVEMSATAISNACDPGSPAAVKREKRYADIMRGYNDREMAAFQKLFQMTVDALEKNPNQDFLGEMFMALELGSHWKGQFFTPYNVCRMMVEIQLHDAAGRIEEKGWIGVNDPACGAGALLIAARNVFARDGIGSDRVLFVAQDIDRVAGLMCYIQLSLLGCAGYVVIADTLCNPITGADPLFPEFNDDHDPWFTPMWYLDVWSARRLWYAAGRNAYAAFHGAAKTQQIGPPAAEAQRSEPEEVKPALPSVSDVAVGEQLRLF